VGKVQITEVASVTDEVVFALGCLVPQLSASAPPPTPEALARIVDDPRTVLFVARSDAGGPIIGCLTLVMRAIPTGMRAWIEDVVVDETARNHGVGEALSRAALARAAYAGCTTVDLTSRPSREAANRLYARLGFELRDTNVYRYDLARRGPT